jgi:hypothetical protein
MLMNTYSHAKRIQTVIQTALRMKSHIWKRCTALDATKQQNRALPDRDRMETAF